MQPVSRAPPPQKRRPGRRDSQGVSAASPRQALLAEAPRLRACRASRGVPVQISVHRLLQQNVPPERRRDVRVCMSRRYQSDLEPYVLTSKHFRHIPTATIALPKSDRSAKCRSGQSSDEKRRKVQRKNKGVRVKICYGGADKSN